MKDVILHSFSTDASIHMTMLQLSFIPHPEASMTKKTVVGWLSALADPSLSNPDSETGCARDELSCASADLLFLSSLQRPSPRRSNSPDKFKRPTPPPSPNTQTPVQPPPPPPPPPMQPSVPSAGSSQPTPSQHSVHPSSQP